MHGIDRASVGQVIEVADYKDVNEYERALFCKPPGVVGTTRFALVGRSRRD